VFSQRTENIKLNQIFLSGFGPKTQNSRPGPAHVEIAKLGKGLGHGTRRHLGRFQPTSPSSRRSWSDGWPRSSTKQNHDMPHPRHWTLTSFAFPPADTKRAPECGGWRRLRWRRRPWGPSPACVLTREWALHRRTVMQRCPYVVLRAVNAYRAPTSGGPPLKSLPRVRGQRIWWWHHDGGSGVAAPESAPGLPLRWAPTMGEKRRWRQPGALPVSDVYRRSGMADEVRLAALILRVRDAATSGLGLGFQPLYFVWFLYDLSELKSSPSQCCRD
jgi:hypothetical protein